MAPPSTKAAWLAASMAGAAVAAVGSGVSTTAGTATAASASETALTGVSPAPAEAPDGGQGVISAAIARDRVTTIIAASRAKREELRPRWVRPGTGVLSSCFCSRWGTFHYGVDLAAPYGSPIYAAGDGVVIEAGTAQGFGEWIAVQHANGDVSVYGHEYKLLVHTGERVQAGQLIALVGSEGESTGPHLHFEVRIGGIDGQRIDPIPWLSARGVAI
ncbi:MAG: M23 family metallopeptidase [Actinobacteria bacterium]|nr:M23 family metallopeptidase [Actinomycetota bacterium]MBI3686129.1 M23 family metallopeptidase [Actinomycetota bacterium]